MRVAAYLAGFLALGSAAFAEPLPLPPVPPTAPDVSEAAPVPNVDAQAPAIPISEEPSINVKLYRARTFDTSAGFAPGSRFQTSEDRKPIQTPGFAITVPLK
jgi:hypothetical protein